MPTLPPGQVETRKFPVVGEQAASPALDLRDWRLRVEGAVSNVLELSYPDVMALPQGELVVDVHCVTGWSRFGMKFDGFPLADVWAMAQPTADARTVRFVAYSDRNHDTSLSLEVARDCWLVHGVSGQPLAPAHGFPLRVVTPNRYFYKSLKWVHRIIFERDAVAGYWERESAYHDNGDPWAEQRFDQSRIASDEATREFRALDNFDRYRRGTTQDVLIQANLSHWKPGTLDLRGLQLKCCNFRGADLANADFRGANLTLSKFRGADLSGADFTAADLEGVDFSGALLTGARLVDVHLTATRFFTWRQNGTRNPPRSVAGMTLQGGNGLLEEQEDFLRSCGIVDPAPKL